ncbi:hypothetical protein, partial [Desulfococcus sp.]|uniref:hypothetical protein n=1 Tax=Desulfococcus sp. TaxID=2025834 RepID=UPI0035938368
MWRRLLILFFFQMALFQGNAAATDLIWGAVVDLDRETGTLNLRMMGASEKSAFHRARHERVRVRFFPEDLPDGIRPGTIVNIWGEPIPGKTPAFTATAIQRERRAHADPTGVRSRLGRAGHNGAGGHGS